MTEKQREYQKYLKSKHWREKRHETFRKQGGKCRICLSKNNIQIHHRKYKDRDGNSVLGNEKNFQLLVLCGECHRLWHKMHKFKHIPFVKLRTGLQRGYSKEEVFRNPYTKFKKKALSFKPKHNLIKKDT